MLNRHYDTVFLFKWGKQGCFFFIWIYCYEKEPGSRIHLPVNSKGQPAPVGLGAAAGSKSTCSI